jgi:thiamine biosynthesis lipoprotein
MKQSATKALCLLTILSIIAATSCARRPRTVKTTWTVMGTFATVSIAGKDAARLPECSRAARKIFDDINTLLSTYSKTSELSRINRFAGIKPVAVSPQTLTCIELSLKYASLSDGAFDPTVLSLINLWGFKNGKPPATLPTNGEINIALDSVGATHVIVKGNTVELDRPGMSFDLGGIAKGYAVDLCYNELRAMNYDSAVINLGGNIRCIGSAPKDSPWTIGVRDPFAKDQTIGTVQLADGMATATSGNYERFVSIEGKRYAHIVDPRTGWPVHGVAAVTVVTTNAIEADALSTALFVAGPDRSAAILAASPSCEALFIEDKQPLSLTATPGFLKIFRSTSMPIEEIKVLKY